MKIREYLKCPYCLMYGLTLMDYGGDEVYECVKCGAEIWHWQEQGIEEVCRQINEEIGMKD